MEKDCVCDFKLSDCSMLTLLQGNVMNVSVCDLLPFDEGNSVYMCYANKLIVIC